jgi:hypothetical protein
VCVSLCVCVCVCVCVCAYVCVLCLCLCVTESEQEGKCSRHRAHVPNAAKTRFSRQESTNNPGQHKQRHRKAHKRNESTHRSGTQKQRAMRACHCMLGAVGHCSEPHTARGRCTTSLDMPQHRYRKSRPWDSGNCVWAGHRMQRRTA